MLVFLAVMIARLGVPLLIPRFPLPAIVAALVIDAADQSIFQLYTDLNLDNYQSYDKALDIYYLAIAYIATLRNWTNLYAVDTARFLWYYRLVGVAAFELIGSRSLLLIFPNTFEYFFGWYEAVRTRWNPRRLTRRHILIAAAFIWIVIKLPQEYWIHIAQLDTTDLIKESVLGVEIETPWGEALSENLWVYPLLIAIAGGLAGLLWWLNRRLPAPDWPTTFDADTHQDEQLSAAVPRRTRDPRHALIEKVALLGLMVVIFSQLMPGLQASALQVAIGVMVVVIANSFVSGWLARRGTEWRSTLTEFAVMLAINFALAVLYAVALPLADGEVRLRVLLFLSFILTIVITFYDRYQPIYDRRVAAGAKPTTHGQSA